MIKFKLLHLMKNKGFTPAQLVTASGLTRQTVKSMMSEYHARIDLDTLEKLCLALDCTPGDLIKME